MGAPTFTKPELDALLDRARAFSELSDRARRRVGNFRDTEASAGDGARAYHLHDGDHHVFLLAPWSVTWPEHLFALAEAQRHTELPEVITRVAATAGIIDDHLPLARHAAPNFLTRLLTGSRTERARTAAQKIATELGHRDRDRSAGRLEPILDTIDRAEQRQRAGVFLFPGADGTPPHLIDAARSVLRRAFDRHIGQPRDYTFLPFEAHRHAEVIERARRLGVSPDAEPALRRRAETLLAQLADQRAGDFLAQLPVDALRSASAHRLRIDGLGAAGMVSVADVDAAELGRLTQIPGVGTRTAQRLKAAAETLRREAHAAEPAAIGRTPSAPARELVDVLARFATGDTLEPDERARRRRLVDYVDLLPGADAGGRWVAALTGTESDNGLWQRFTDDLAWGAVHPELLEPPRPAAHGSRVTDCWEDYLSRPAHYQGLLATLLSDDDGETGAELDTPTLEAVRALRLDRSLLSDELHLRGYQSFGARFAVVRRKVILGDEMGLGKTVQALAAAAHVAATDGIERTRILVICPASVVVNWKREASRFTTLPVHVAHGPLREDTLRAWEGTGGICILTFDGARTSDITASEFVIVDEAHYIKNPQAQRSQAARTLIDGAKHALLMTGTPLENRVEEFAALVDYVDDGLLRAGMETMDAQDFRRRIAPVYLRRNQSDVLEELPGVTEQTDWVELTTADERWYRGAVAEGGWMAVRRAPLTTPDALPAKISRVREIVEEAEEAGRRVVVFSFFLDVPERLAGELGERVLATITGALAPGARQEAVDKLDDAPAGSVLLAQITAAGTGLNMQAASVVILTEPQVKPSLEAQAVARLNRMGQTRPVLAHRLIAEDTADERMLEMLGRKERIFDAFARESESAGVPDAVDVSEPKLAAEIIAAERRRLGIDVD